MDRPRGPRPRASLRRRVAAGVLRASLLGVAVASPARADGGAVLLRGSSGGLEVTLFGEPAPLRAGPADLSVLVQDAASGATLLDGTVDLHLEPPAESGLAPIDLRPDAARATNKLLRASPVALGTAGAWHARVDVTDGGRHARVDGVLDVGPERPALARLWPWLALPVVASALFAWREWLLLGRPAAGGRRVSSRARAARAG
ncbi:MAG: hypothetical protein ACKOCT_08165 [Alphaproteobacteria bacterium]